MGSTDPAAMRAVAGKLADAESIVALKDLFNRVGAGDTRAEGVEGVGADSRAAYLFNSNLVGVEDADLVLLVGSDPRLEAPVLNARLRRANVAGGTHVASVGPHGDLTYPVESIGSSAAAIEALASGKHPFRARLDAAERPLIIVGASLLRRPDRDALMKHLHALCDASGVVKGDWNGFNVLHDAGGTVAALDLGFVPSTSAAASKSSAPSLVYSLGAEAFDAPPSAFVVYQGHHGDAGAARADVVLPGAAYTEKPGTYVNTEGRAQRAMPAVAPHGQAQEDWKILRALSEVCGAALPYDDLDGVRARLAEIAPHFARVDDVEPALWLNGATYAHVSKDRAKVLDDAAPLASSVVNFYMTDAISRASATMAKATKAKAAETR
jgi:NADH dehydrogenase (ubiquinone) Fe-S protein 1